MDKVQELYGEEMVCPHCGMKQLDPLAPLEQSGVLECDHCDNQFHYSRRETVIYSTWVKP